MERIVSHIRELLYDHDCVIIPGFGGFIAHNEPSSLHPVQHRFNPPGRFILFNALLEKDDGLLIHAISSVENISFSQVKSDVEQFVSDCHHKLNEGESLVFEGIGRFAKNRELSIVFVPEENINFLKKSFGLIQLISPPIHREKVRKRSSGKRVDRKPRTESQPLPGSVRWTVITALPVILFLLWGILFPSSVSNFYENHAGFFDRFIPVKKVNISQPVITADKKVIKVEALPPVIIQDLEATSVNKEPVSIVQSPEIPSVSDKTPEINASGQNYHIIGGVFQNPENAENLVNELRQRGFDAILAGKNRSGLLRVSYKSFITREEAISYLDFIRKNENQNAWILKY